jgi:hypothetical protein
VKKKAFKLCQADSIRKEIGFQARCPAAEPIICKVLKSSCACFSRHYFFGGEKSPESHQ